MCLFCFVNLNEPTTQQALPRSAILTCSFSALTGSRGFTNRLPDAPGGKGENKTEVDKGQKKTNEHKSIRHM